MFPAGAVITNPDVPGTAAIADSMSDRFTVPPGLPLRNRTSAIATRIDALVVELAPERPAMTKLIAVAIGDTA